MSFSLPAYTCNINETFAALFNCKIVLPSGTAIIILIHSQNYCCYISLVMFNAPFSKTLLLQVLLVTFTHAPSLFQPFTIKGSIGIVIKIIFFLENIHSPMFIRVRTLFQAKNSRTFQGLSRTLTRNFKDFFNDNFTSKPRKMFVLTSTFWVYR